MSTLNDSTETLPIFVTWEANGIVSDELLRILSIVLLVVLCQGACIFGTITNIINLIVFVRIGYSDTINISFTALAISDLGTCFILIWHTIALNPWFQQLDLPWERTSISYITSSWPHVIFAKLTTILTAFISFERCLCVILPLKVKSIITRKIVKGVVVCTFLVGVLSFAKLYYTNWYDWKFYPEVNETLLTLFFSDDREEIESVYYPIFYTGLPLVCLTVVTVSTILMVSALRKNSKWKQQAIATRSTSTSTEKGQTMSSKELKVVKMVATISTLYIVCFLPNACLALLMTADRSVSINGTNKNLLRVMGATTFFLQCVNSGCNLFIYYCNSTVYRTTLDSLCTCRRRKPTPIVDKPNC